MNSFNITFESSLGGPPLGLCSAWRFVAIWRLIQNVSKKVLYIVTQIIECYVKVVELSKQQGE